MSPHRIVLLGVLAIILLPNPPRVEAQEKYVDFATSMISAVLKQKGDSG